ncbi:PI-PLC X domain-containing protein 1-like [Hetaerina americana]|uniref:PI-PLC X domain-containing protein 1-like n=1 Tax=Hetaerina americana TaxID=62018 RepID=UPI003A7F12CC
MRRLASAALVVALVHLATTRYVGFRRHRAVAAPEPCHSGLRVSLVVSSVGSGTGDTRLLEVNWEDAPLQAGDYMAVFDEDPALATGHAPLFSFTPATPSGSTKTDLISKIPDDDIGYVERCYGHWVAYLRPAAAGGTADVLASACVKTRPTWMHDLRPQIGQKRLRDLFIPGSHDSGSFAEGEGDRLTKYTYTQEESILHQLIFGCRYLDIRVGYYPPSVRRLDNGTWVQVDPGDVPDEDVFWVNHGIVKIRKLKVVLDSVKEFLSSTKEIVIFDVQEFPVGFSGSDDGLAAHVRLMAFLGRELGPYAANVSMGGMWWDTPLNTFWKEDRRLIIGYDNSDAREKAQEIAEAEGKGRGGSIIWKEVTQKWGNVRSTEDLRAYLTAVLGAPPSSVWSAMAELTPNAWDIISDGPGGLRKMADAVNRNVSEWFGGTWGHYANVVATDYFRANEVVEAAIAWNFRRAVWSTECRKL